MKLGLSLLGLVVAAFAGRLLWVALQHPPIDRAQLYVLIGVFGVGLLLVEGVSSTLAAALTALGAAIGKYLPWMKGGAS